MSGKPAFDRRELTGPFDIIGDVHGCCDELELLLAKLGYGVVWDGEDVSVSAPAGRMAVFVGDLTDRGPRSPDVVRVVMAMCKAEIALCVEGNHDSRFGRWLKGAQVKTGHGLQAAIDQMDVEPAELHAEAKAFFTELPPYLWLDGGKLVVAHAGLRAEMVGKEGGKVKAFALYGDTTGEVDGYGSPVRRNWALEHPGEPAIVYGHVAAPEVQSINNTWCIDTGCCFGGELTALRWPERELVSVKALKVWCEAARPLAGRTR